MWLFINKIHVSSGEKTLLKNLNAVTEIRFFVYIKDILQYNIFLIRVVYYAV